ncbi:hypothetical protein GJ699_04610 [Duganella sp. FT80W]|uniref:DUF3368 domain-containing protein n=1 Tax=Duganella guangzhouensis TaxID=2666084 RepID=A0A6I2KW40_9BURK|nr:hypothetical protein [Duganella guangzhouensis]MRW89257.1 hypothetical protein [Duganella guangzhouensis]
MNIALIVTDAGPLITLAVADALDTLKLLGARVLIPDMVEFEVGRHTDKPGARIFLAWLEANRGAVEIARTEEFAEFSRLLALDPDLRTRNRGEMAAAEATFLHALERRKLIADAELILDRATAVPGPTARVDGGLATSGADDALNAWIR